MAISDSEYTTSSASSTDSEEDISDILRHVGMNKKYGKIFAKAKIEDLEDARELTETRLKKIGITSSTDRKKILKAIARAGDSDSDSGSSSSSSSSESDSESEDEIEAVLDKHGLKKYSSKLHKNNITSLRSARKLSDSKLKDFGIDSSKTRSKILKALGSSSSSQNGSSGKVTATLKKRDSSSSSSKESKSSKSSITLKTKTNAKTSTSSTDTIETNRKKIFKVLKKSGLESIALKLDENNIHTLEQARSLSPNRLKSFGIDTVSSRSAVMDAFKNYNDTKSSSSDSETEQEGEAEGGEKNIIKKALSRVNMQKYYDFFQKRGVTSIRQAQELGHNELKDIGIDNLGHRELCLEAFSEADWKCVYCQTWNEHRKTCMICQKTHRRVTTRSSGYGSGEEVGEKFEHEQKVKYIGRFRPTTRIKYGEKGVIHRVLEDDNYMVKFTTKDKKTVSIRLQQNELAAIK